MADVYVEMADDGESPAKCRQARRRRMEMRRLDAVVAGDPPSPGHVDERRDAVLAGDPPSPGHVDERREVELSLCPGGDKRRRTSEEDPPPLTWPQPPFSSPSSSSSSSGRAAEAVASTSESALEAPKPPLAFGSVSLSGRSREMEDAVSVRPGFFRFAGGSPLHFFAVFDGHGGAHVSELCRERMHLLLAEELGRELEAADDGEELVRWRVAVERCFGRMDELALAACACGKVPCGCERPGIESHFVGSTAVVSLLARDRLLVANCGDSRAVLSRGGRALPLSSDHKPDRPDELARIEAAGGRVIYVNGARVDGILAMSRALGDRFLKPIVIAEPEVMIVERTHEDECLIIASDGLWDVVPNDLACDIARRCLEEGDPTKSAEDISSRDVENRITAEGEEYASEERCSVAAALLARLALGRKSADNISVIVIDLRGN